MRIACVYLPSFPLQAHIRQAPHLAGTSLAVADGVATSASIIACSRAAWADGIRPGMAVTTARAIAPELEVVLADRALYRRTLDALVESLLPCSESIDIGDTELSAAHRAIYLTVPPRARGASFGQKILTHISRQGFRGRVGVADDRFTAYLAAVRVEHRGRSARLDEPNKQPPLFHQSCTTVPRGGSAAFLAPLPLSHLPIDPDVQHLLETCGVKTLGDFAALPPPSVGRDISSDPDSDFQALARGQGSHTVRAHDLDRILERPLIERMELVYEVGESQPLSFALRTLADHVSHRLEGRERGAAEIELRLYAPSGTISAITVRPAHATMSSQEIQDVLMSELESRDLDHQPVVALELEITRQAEPSEPTLDLFAHFATRPAHATLAVRAEPGLRKGQASRRPHIPMQPTRPGKSPRRRHANGQQSLPL